MLVAADHRLGNILLDDALEHFVDQLLAGQPVRVGVKGLDLVAQPPVADPFQARREQGSPLIVDQVPQVDVVLGNVGLGLAEGRGRVLAGAGRQAGKEQVAAAGIGPVQPVPAGSQVGFFGQGVAGEIEQDLEGDLAGEQVVADVGGGVDLAETQVDGQDLSLVQVQWPVELQADAVHVAVQRLQIGFEALEESVQPLGVGDEVQLAELGEFLGAAVMLAPECSRLENAPIDAKPQVVAVSAQQVLAHSVLGILVDEHVFASQLRGKDEQRCHKEQNAGFFHRGLHEANVARPGFQVKKEDVRR